jgi:hypothetical protein
VIAALRDLEIAVVPRGQLDVGLGNQIDERTARGRCGFVHRLDHRLVLVGSGHREDLREAGADERGLFAQAARDDDAAVVGGRRASRLSSFAESRKPQVLTSTTSAPW